MTGHNSFFPVRVEKKNRYLVPHPLLFQDMPPFSGVKSVDNLGVSYPGGPSASPSRIPVWHSWNGRGLSLPPRTHTEYYPSLLIPHFPFYGIPIFVVTNQVPQGDCCKEVPLQSWLLILLFSKDYDKPLNRDVKNTKQIILKIMHYHFSMHFFHAAFQCAFLYCVLTVRLI